MSLNNRFRNVNCDYCNNKATVVNGTALYGLNHRLANKYFYYCEPCQAWVGMHEGSKKPFGLLANASLRKKRLEAHKVFDVFWINAKKPQEERKKAYEWLASKMNIPVDKCHIGMFNEEECKIAIRFCLIRKKSAYR